MKKIITVDGNEAAARTAYLFTEVAGIYPITPASPMAEHIDAWSNEGKKNAFNHQVKVIEMQSESGASGLVHGSLQSGLLTTTFTASQGLLLMIPNMYKMAGEMLPAVIHVAARSLATHALSIFGDHQDIYATRMTGFNMLASSSVQDATYLAAVAHISALEASLPFLHFFDGFRTSHEIDKIETLEDEDFISLLPKDKVLEFRNRALNPMKPIIKGTAQNDDVYFQITESRNKFYDKVPDIVNKTMKKLNALAGTNYQPFNYYGHPNAKYVIVAMGSVCETIKETIDASKSKIGLIEVHLYRPFSSKYFLKVLPSTVEKIAVLDRTKEPGSNGEPLYLDVVNLLKDKKIRVVGGRYGLSSKNTTPGDIKAVYHMLRTSLKNSFTIGITDNVTHYSLPREDLVISKHDEVLIYGYGSDGMVSASKSILKLVGDNTDKHVQGYFEYDSKKSGGVTIGHLRFSDEVIHSTYYVENPKLIVVTKDNYFKDFSVVHNIKKKGVLLVNTSLSKENFEKSLSNKTRKLLKEKEVSVYLINAYSLARKLGLGNKISMIMTMAIINLSKIMDSDLAKEKLKEYISSKFFKKGEKVIKLNQESLDLALEYMEKVTLTSKDKTFDLEKPTTVFESMRKRLGNSLTTKDLLSYSDGSFPVGTALLEKRGISDIVPMWINENCIKCNQCSFVCPHSVIRPFLLDKNEYEKAPKYIQKRCIKQTMKELEDYYFCIGISIKDCTGCGLCMKTCPGKKGNKALIPSNLNDRLKQNEQQAFEYLDKYIKVKDTDTSVIYGSQFKKPKFSYCGSCAGCGESGYIKVLTQLFGEHMIIANATGCSSIYGGSAPSMPYTLPWANSLFEDNAEFGYGILMANQVMKNNLKEIMLQNMDNKNHDLFQKWIDNMDDYQITKEVYDNLDYKSVPDEIRENKDYLVKRSIWTIGGDGWAYDIGFSGIDHVLASNDDVNILVLDSQVYSNTGGQASKASPEGAIASFASFGKKTGKKDLATIALSYPHVYVAQISMGANMASVLRAFKEAEAHKGPSIIIAYSPCISHGIEGGMVNSIEMEKLATYCGYFPIFRYNPIEKHFHLDFKNPHFDDYEEFLSRQTRFSMLKKINPDEADRLLEEQKKLAMDRFASYLKRNEEEKYNV